ncbi:D-sedoheptulose 7-phosphate isomerase [Candidatus Curculioniphilus buchneri]|uniref:D-sedoheptulose 7-phosphate isomerase n=1 Tax=Candidatus Curculioniphilus buchneri TaxID=690594 RepID=UPI00376F389F
MYKDLIYNEFSESVNVLQKFISSARHLQSIEDAAQLISYTFKSGGKLFSCGNGGSHCDAMHLAEELTGLYREKRPSYPAISISDPSHISCVSNDFGYEKVFSRYIEAIGQQGDVLVGLSTSGNSLNIIEAVDAAHTKGMKTIVLTGRGGGKVADRTDIEIRIPHFGYADRIQEMHIKIIHVLILIIEKEMLKTTTEIK